MFNYLTEKFNIVKNSYDNFQEDYNNISNQSSFYELNIIIKQRINRRRYVYKKSTRYLRSNLCSFTPNNKQCFNKVVINNMCIRCNNRNNNIPYQCDYLMKNKLHCTNNIIINNLCRIHYKIEDKVKNKSATVLYHNTKLSELSIEIIKLYIN